MSATRTTRTGERGEKVIAATAELFFSAITAIVAIIRNQPSPRSRAIFRNLKENLSRIIGIDGLVKSQEFDNIFALSCRDPKRMPRKIP